MSSRRLSTVVVPLSLVCLAVALLLLSRPSSGQAPGRGAAARTVPHFDTWIVPGDPPYVVVFDSETGHYWSHPASLQAEWTDLGTPAKRRR